MAERPLFFVVAGPEGYGVRNVWTLLSRALGRRGQSILIAVLDRAYVEVWKENFPDAEVIHPPAHWRALPRRSGQGGRLGGIVRRGLSQLKLAWWLDGVVRDSAARAIIFQGPIESLLCGLVARRQALPAFWFVPNAISDGRFLDLNKRIYRGLFRHANVIPVANSHFTDRTLGAGDFPRHVVHLGVDTVFYNPSLDQCWLRDWIGIPTTATVVGLFARMTPSKGQLGLVEALAEIREDVHLLFCGGPLETDYHQDLVAAATALNVRERVHFAGFQTDLRPYYGACDIVANLRTDPEPFGLTIVEAMACGKPVLAHAAGGPTETVLDGQTGWLISNCGTDDIAEGLRQALADRPRWHEMSRASRARAVGEFSIDCFEAKAVEVVEAEITRFKRCAGTRSGGAVDRDISG